MRGNLEYVACNNCRRDDYKLLFVKNGFNIAQCHNCGLVYTNPRICSENSTDIYNETYFKSHNSLVSGYEDYIKDRPTIEATFQKRINYIFDNAPSLASLNMPSVLDVGCAAGFLLNLFRLQEWEVEGIELSAFARFYAVNEFNLPVHFGTLSTANVTDSHYDLITSWDVIEHSYDPKGDLIKMHSLLKSEGYLALITPDRDSFHARLLGSKWVEYAKPEEHLYFFGKRILRKILEEIGFDLVAVATAGKYVSLSFALTRLKSYSGIFGALGNLLGKNILNKNLYINPFDKMFLLAKKR